MNRTNQSSAGRDTEVRTIGEVLDIDDLSPEKTLNILGSEIRLSILRALWEAPEDRVSFTDLRESPYLDTNNLDYHLDKLVGHFVRRSDDGYSLRYPGERVIRAMLTGMFTKAPTLSPREIDTRCPYCGDRVELRYEEEQLTARCMACSGVTQEGFPEGTILSYGFPPSGLRGRSPDEILEAAHVLYDSEITPMMNGICPKCASTVGYSFDICGEHDLDETGLCGSCGTRFEVWTEYRCDHCAYSRKCALWFKVLLEPTVIAFYHEEGGLDETIPFSKLTWRNARYVSDISTAVVSEEPLRFRVDIPLEDARLTVMVDEELEIRHLERIEASEAGGDG